MLSPDYPITIPSITDLKRREFLSSAFAAALLIACGGDDDQQPQQTTRVIDTLMGPVEIPVAPQRIVAGDIYTLQALDELNAPLVAAATFANGTRVQVSDEARNLPSVGWWETDLEAVAAANPDLIVAIYDWQQGNYEKLSAIAPTVLIDYGAENWRELYLSMAEPVGLGDAARKKLTPIDARLKELQSAIERKWPTGVSATVLQVVPDAVATYTSAWSNIPTVGLLNELGIRFAADALPNPEQKGKLALSLEQLRNVDADVIFYYVGGGAATGVDVQATAAALTSNPLWTSLTAVKAGRAYAVDSGPWFDACDMEGVNLILDDLETYLTS